MSLDLLIRLIEAAVDSNRGSQRRTPILYRPGPPPVPQQQQRPPGQVAMGRVVPLLGRRPVAVRPVPVGMAKSPQPVRRGPQFVRQANPYQLGKRVVRGPARPMVAASGPPRVQPNAPVATAPLEQRPAPAVPPTATPLSSVDARGIARWLNPSTLRRQFMLTEIFQPPVALRDDHLTFGRRA
jgi:hypothetical protein